MSLIATRARAKSGEPRAQFELAIRYWHGDGVPHSARRFWDWLGKAVEAGLTDALDWAAMIYEEGLLDRAGRAIVKTSYPKAKRMLELAASQGSRTAALHLGVLLDLGQVIPQDSLRALQLYKSVLPEGAYNIATWYRDRGRNRDAVRWFRKALQLGDPSALVDLGYCLLFGVGTRAAPEQGILLLRKAIRSRWISEWEREECLYFLGLAYSEGRGLKRSTANALRLLKRSTVDDDYPEATTLLKAVQNHGTTRACRCRRGRPMVTGNARCPLHDPGRHPNSQQPSENRPAAALCPP